MQRVPDRFKRPDQAYQFYGSFDKLISGSASTWPSNDRTISFWIKHDFMSPLQTVLSYGGLREREGSSFLILVGKDKTRDADERSFIEIQGHHDKNLLYAFLDQFTKEIQCKWAHFVVVIKRTASCIYLNGNELTHTHSKAFEIPTYVNHESDFIVGGTVTLDGRLHDREDGRAKNFRGQLDSVRVYNRVLSHEEITALHQYEWINPYDLQRATLRACLKSFN